MLRTAVLLTLICVLVLPAIPAAAQDWSGKGRIQGRVEDENGDPVEGATVTLLKNDFGPEPLTTNKKGRWSFLGLHGGTWTVKIESNGFVPSEGSVSVTEFGVNPSLDIRLRPIPEEVLREAAAQQSLELLGTGNELLAAGKPAEARAEFETALEALDEENHPPVLMGIARTYYQEDNLEQAEATLHRVLEIDPDDVDALKLLSGIMVATGREEEAMVFMDRLPEGEMLDADAYLNVGIELYNNSNLEAALEEFGEVVERFPELPAAYYYRGLVLLNLQNNEGATADFEKFLELKPDGPRAAEVKEFLSYLNPGE
jgi:tetratricopeptide (TPR) repeat protein